MNTRKRALFLIGLGAVACSASTFSQHPIPPAQRTVEYATSSTRTTTSQPQHNSNRKLVQGSLLPSIHADASVDDPDPLFRRLRRLTSDHDGTFSNNAFVDASANNNDHSQSTPGFNVSTQYDVKPSENSTDSATVLNTEYDSDDAPNSTTTPPTTSTTNQTHQQAQRYPIRIGAYLSQEAGGAQFLSSRQRSYLLQSILRPALLAWSAALRVVPVAGNLTVDATQLYQQQYCGPGHPSVAVPSTHLQQGVNNTDFLVYVNLAFSNTTRPFQFWHPQRQNDEEPERCHGNDYLAASSVCSTDQWDRPIAALLHLCITDDFFDRNRLHANIMLVQHELAHSLGFNAVSLAHFRRPDGSPWTDRDVNGTIPLTEIECTGPAGHRTDRVQLPSEDILQFRTVRGGVRVAQVVTPSVRQVVRNHFDCQALEGAELESGIVGDRQGSCLGDHWERRLFKSDLMNPLVDDTWEFTPLFSTVTLAYFADSGWYQVDLSRATSAASWGRAAGCDFVEQTCIHDGEVPPEYESFFCNTKAHVQDGDFSADIHGCTSDLSRKASCSLHELDASSLPDAYQYFENLPIGGNDPFGDFCPVYAGFENGLCSDEDNEAFIQVNYIERFGRKNSRCLSGNLLRMNEDYFKDSSSSSDEIPPASMDILEQTALCLPIACVVEDRSLRVMVDGIWDVCRYKDEVLLPKKTNGPTTSGIMSVVCPDPVRVCPTFYCNRDCLGTYRACNYDVGLCVCPSFKLDASFYNQTREEMLTAIQEPCTALDSEKFYGSNRTDDGLPDPDSPLSDYYVRDARSLKDEYNGFWNVISISVVSVFGVFVLAASLYLFWPKTRNGRSFAESSDGFDDDGFVPSLDPTTREKHKMLASVVVDMRMNRTTNVQRRVDILMNRDSETDVSMTETEGTSDAAWQEDSAVFSRGTIADLSEHITIPSTQHEFLAFPEETAEFSDPLAHPPTRRVFRRRHHLENPS